MLFGVDSGLLFVLLVVNFNVDYEKLCVFDVLGLVDFVIGDQSVVYDEFKEQLVCFLEGWYEIGLFWRGNCFFLLNNWEGSLCRLNIFVWKLRKIDLLDEYDVVIREQLEEGVVE